MAYLVARITYHSRNQYIFHGRSDEVKSFFTRIRPAHRGGYEIGKGINRPPHGVGYWIGTYSGVGLSKPGPDVHGFSLEFDEETMMALVAAFNEMSAQETQTNS